MASLFQRSILIFAFVLLAVSILHAQDSCATCYLEQSLSDLCGQIQDLIPVTAMLLVITAGVVYSAGQFFGAETRARANVWATSCLTGAIIGIIIAVVAPYILSQLAGGAPITCGGS
ncbi:MAG: hypothetical protein KGH63_02095 [Candidatus Micrarchaeota archaeon]|nr:hypothetical protein [Candidatus Micrarchaeota archaeon]